ncbi:MAG: chromate transporter, partial [Hyphomicrobiales bacterium]|nr:chromate transporter [Hyphomicrobiales bacterium]
IRNPRLSGALAGVTAAVVGVIVSLALWFGTQVFFSGSIAVSVSGQDFSVPDPSSAQFLAIALSGVAAVLLFAVKLSVPWTVAVMAALGLVTGFVF